MIKKILILLLSVSSLTSTLFADSLQQAVVETLNTNPNIQERLKNFRATQQDLNVAEADYYPQLDLTASVGYANAGAIKDSGDSDFNHKVDDVDYNNYESSLTFTQNLFNGFSTMHQVDFEEAQVLAAAYKYLETSNDMAFKMTDAYLNVLRSFELVGTARENVQINESIYQKVRDLFESGLTTESEVKKIQSALSLARSNLTVQKNNARDSEYKYRKILGRLPDISEMSRPVIDVEMPQSVEKAALFAVENNPSLLVSRYNIKGAQALWQQRKKDYYPKLDLEISQAFNDNNELNNGFDQPDDRFRARLVLSYNLFRGGADKATVQKHISMLSQEVEIQRALKREVVEGLDLSWNAYKMIDEQLKDLREYSEFSEKTLELYKEEYDLGRRSLLDLLSAQNDVINSRSQIIDAEYDQLFSKYRILDAMGLLVIAINGSSEEFTSKVNLYSDEKASEVLDTLPIKMDVDNDNINDNIDLCDNSLKENNIMPYGCEKIKKDDDMDGVFNEKDECPFTPAGLKVTEYGCEVDSDSDGIKDSLDECENTPKGYGVDERGCADLITMSVNFSKDSTAIPEALDAQINEFVDFMKKYPELKARIIGHTSRVKASDEKYNLNLSKMRAAKIKDELIKHGIDSDRLASDGKGFHEPIADNTTQEGKALNRRVEIQLVREYQGDKL